MADAIVKCRFCNNQLRFIFVDLGMSPLANSYLSAEDLNKMEPHYPLCAHVCEECYLVQLAEYQSPEAIFSDYLYFSSYSESWLKHAKAYTDLVLSRFGYDSDSLVIEVASNDGYLLQYFQEKGVPVLGIEPAQNVAEIANQAGIPTLTEFFGTKIAKALSMENKKADLLIGNNVLAHVPNLNDFVNGIKILLKNDGVATIEFPHLMSMIEQNQFDTIYHEHFSYFSFTTAERVFAGHGLTLFDVEELPTHGNSLRIYVRHQNDKSKPITERVWEMKQQEEDKGFTSIEYYLSFGEKVKKTKRNILDFLIKAKRDKKSIAGYGAPAKGNTLLNYCGIRTDFIEYTVDRSPHKQEKYLPGTHIPIYHPDKINESKPDYLVILPWNLKDEIMQQMGHIRDWGGQFVVLIPEPMVLP